MNSDSVSIFPSYACSNSYKYTKNVVLFLKGIQVYYMFGIGRTLNDSYCYFTRIYKRIPLAYAA